MTHVRSLTKEDLSQVVEVHVRAFPTFFLVSGATVSPGVFDSSLLIPWVVGLWRFTPMAACAESLSGR